MTQCKLDVWFDKKDLKPGSWKPQILKAISRSKHFLICISNAALRKTGDERPGFTDTELTRAYEIAMAQPESEFTIVPVRIEECDRGGCDVRMTSFQQYDLFDDMEKGLDLLAVHLGGISLVDAKAEDSRSEGEKVLLSLAGRAQALYYAGDFNNTLKIFESILILRPDFAAAWFGKGTTLSFMERHEEALKSYEKAIELKPDHAEAWYNKGVDLGNLGRPEKALKSYEKAIELKPDLVEAWHNKG